MRRRLVTVFLAVSVIAALAFVVPLGLVIRQTGFDRAVQQAELEAAEVAAAVAAAGDDRADIYMAVRRTSAGTEGRMTVALSDGTLLGVEVADPVALAETLSGGVSTNRSVAGGHEVVSVVTGVDGRRAGVRVFVPDADLYAGQARAWTTLLISTAALVTMSVLLADRLAQSVVAPTRQLAATALRLSAGDLEARVVPQGPHELEDLGEAVNQLGARISTMLEVERELLAEMSHRLRTPLTALRMRLQEIEDPELAERLSADVNRLTVQLTALIDETRNRPAAPETVAVDPSAAIARRVEFWAVLAADQERPWRFERSTGPATVALTEDELVAAVDVLIENVFRHTDEGVGLTVWVHQEPGWVRIGVQDTGPGFSPELVTAGRSAGGSSGLGLAIAERTAARVGGHLEINQPAGGGVIVELVLPELVRGRAAHPTAHVPGTWAGEASGAGSAWDAERMPATSSDGSASFTR